MAEGDEEKDEKRVDWVVPVGKGTVDYRHFDIHDLENMAKQGIHIEPNADRPKDSRVTKTVVEGMPAPKKK